MKRKLTAVILAAVGCMGNAVYAQTVADVKNTNGVISVNGTTTADTTVTLTVKSEDSGELFAIKETVSSSAGNFGFEFKLKPEDAEVSSYLLKIKGDSIYTKNLSVYSEEKKETFLNDIKNADAQSLKQILDSEDGKIILENLGMDSDTYLGLTEEKKVKMCNSFCNDRSKYAEADIIDLLNAEIALINSKSGTEAFGRISAVDKLGIAFTDSSDFVKNRLKDSEYNNIEEFEKLFDEFEAVDAVNNAKYSDMEELFANNTDILGLTGNSSYTRYKGMGESAKRKVNQNIVTALKDKPAQNTEDFLKIFEEYAKTSSGNNGGGGGGGSSSSSGKGSSSSSSYPGGAGTTSDNTSFQIPVTQYEKIEFSDVDDGFWAKEAIEYLAEKKIVNGYEDGSFKPQNNITREEFVTLIAKAFEFENIAGECNFDDVEEDKWYYKYVAISFERGVAKGISETEFGIGKNITRQDAAVMISRLLNLEPGNSEKFADDSDIADYASEAVYLLKDNGIISGDENNCFNPHNSLTRAECAVMVKKALEKK